MAVADLASDDRSRRRSVFEILRRVMAVRELRHSWRREDNFQHTDLVDLKLGEDSGELLKQMSKDGLLIESGVTTILVCPSCGKPDYVAILRCVKCGQSSIRRERLIEHKADGRVHPESAFTTKEGYICPSCGKALKPTEYRVLGTWFICEKCGEKQQQPKLEFRCLTCQTIFTEATADTRKLSDYKISEKGIAQLEYDKYKLIDELQTIAERIGLNTLKEAATTGSSGIKHTFDLTINTESEDIKIDIAYSKDAVDGKDVLASYAKLIDTNTKRYLLIAWPKLSGEAKNLATHYKMNVIEASTFEELERSFTSFLGGLRGNRSSSSSNRKYEVAAAAED
jgi:predicted RNA-binding Zn-ribbon protein involved in translation (DUF1610 family)